MRCLRLLSCALAGLAAGCGRSPIAPSPAAGPGTAVAREYRQTFLTYPYSDPDPVPRSSRIYPYFRYDGYTDTPSPREWKVVELSNDYLRVLILPEIGGKVWTAIEKSTGRAFIYYNRVVKFRDISMRGPWTSGGMEANYGIIGHTANCFSPVDYLVRQEPDGSARCIVGGLDLLTRTPWRLEISLPADKAFFTTRSFWHNASGLDQSYYSWMNVGIKAAGHLQFVNPGTAYLGHDGRASIWPVNAENGREISWYDRNDFGGPKSYHVIGRLSEFFGGYWHDEDFGMVHTAPHEEKPGKKIWIWGLSRQGMIWEKLLTDGDGQYVEVQSGRLFNQAAGESSRTPFKHREFPPYATDVWTEHWFPVKGIRGFVSASPYGAMNVTTEKGRLTIRLSPVQALRDRLEVCDGDRLLDTREVDLQPMCPLEVAVALAAPPRHLRVLLGGDKLRYEAGDGDVLSRPLEAPKDFDWNSVYGLYVRGQELSRQRDHAGAEAALRECLKKDLHFLPALAEMAALANGRADHASARDFARRALAIDAYDPRSNYQFGVAAAALGRTADAHDAFGIASQSVECRAAALTRLALLFLRDRRLDRALGSARGALDQNRLNLDALQVRACVHRLRREPAEAAAALEEILALDPLSAFARFEKSPGELAGLVRNELPHETYLELAAWYRHAGLAEDAARVLERAPPTAEVLYWLAWLRRDTALLARAEAASPAFVFPFRAESIPVFEWALQRSKAWPAAYYLALVLRHQGETVKARDLMFACGDKPEFAPFYALRAQLDLKDAPRDLQRAAELDPGQWRYGIMLAEDRLKRRLTAGALETAADYARRFPGNSAVALLHARMLMLDGRHAEAADLLSSLHILPCEGSSEARSMHREAHLWVATGRMKAGEWGESLKRVEAAREWPERLGAGRPYSEDCDEILEDWLAFEGHRGRGAPDEAKKSIERILAAPPRPKGHGTNGLIVALALRESGQAEAGLRALKDRLAKESDSAAAKWALEVYEGRPSSAAPGDPVGRILGAWLGR
jgi:tetratricopeptide (TPR) repeat protein